MAPAPASAPALRETEVEDLDRAVGRELDVRGFQIAMDDAALVRGFERVGDLSRDRQRFVQRNRPCAMRSASVGPSTSSRTSARCLRVLEAVDLRDVRMVQRRERPALRARKRASRSGSAANASGRTLIATSRFSLRVARAIHLAHAARADQRDDFVSADTGAGSHSHRSIDNPPIPQSANLSMPRASAAKSMPPAPSSATIS